MQSEIPAEPASDGWKDDLRNFLEVMRTTVQIAEHACGDYNRQLDETLASEVYPAFEEFLSEMTRHGIGGQIFGRGTGYGITLRLDDGFEVAVERDRYREQAHLLPRLIFIQYFEEGGRQCLSTDGVSWDRIRKAEVVDRVLTEYKRWRLLSLLSGRRAVETPSP